GRCPRRSGRGASCGDEKYRREPKWCVPACRRRREVDGSIGAKRFRDIARSCRLTRSNRTNISGVIPQTSIHECLEHRCTLRYATAVVVLLQLCVWLASAIISLKVKSVGATPVMRREPRLKVRS